jgi:hypothetical protein
MQDRPVSRPKWLSLDHSRPFLDAISVSRCRSKTEHENDWEEKSDPFRDRSSDPFRDRSGVVPKCPIAVGSSCASSIPRSCSSSSSSIPQIVNSREPSDWRGKGERSQFSDSFGPHAPIEDEDEDENDCGDWREGTPDKKKTPETTRTGLLWRFLFVQVSLGGED